MKVPNKARKPTWKKEQYICFLFNELMDTPIQPSFFLQLKSKSPLLANKQGAFPLG
jgi:hypothetical protein